MTYFFSSKLVFITCNCKFRSHNSEKISQKSEFIFYPDLTNVHFSGVSMDFLFLYGILFIHRNGLWRAYDTQLAGLGLWGRCVLYVRQNAYYMHANKVRIICTQKLQIICMSKTVSFCV